MRYLSGHRIEPLLWVSHGGGAATTYMGPPAFSSSPVSVTSAHSVPRHPLTTSIKIHKDRVLELMM